MRCEVAQEHIGALLDGELPNGQHREVAEHSETCPACARYRDELTVLRRRLSAARRPAPPGLAGRVQVRLAVEQSNTIEPASADSATTVSLPAIASTVTRWRPLLRHAAVLLVACAISVAATWWQTRDVNIQTALARDVLAAHVRSLLQDRPIQVASSDMHTVKPWFAGRLEFTPVVKDLSAEGFELVGGRLDYIGGRRVAALVYRKRLHQVNVFIWPNTDDVSLKRETLEGYNVVNWSRGGMTFWAISDLNAGELRELQSLL